VTSRCDSESALDGARATTRLDKASPAVAARSTSRRPDGTFPPRLEMSGTAGAGTRESHDTALAFFLPRKPRPLLD
jgi:hypothetical protein